MADTDLHAVLSEILIKQDRQTEILTQFMEVYVRHFQSEINTRSIQTAYHLQKAPVPAEKFQAVNSDSEKLSSIERILQQMLELESQIRRLERSTIVIPGISVTG